jgi:hypothetical protein
MAGYSGTPLPQKLGIKPHTRIAILAAPRGYRVTLGKLPAGVTVLTAARGILPLIQFFTTRRRSLETRFAGLVRALSPDGALWVSWPKKSAGVATDVTEDVVRAVALPGGLVDVKVCAVDETWSALKLVRRLKDR